MNKKAQQSYYVAKKKLSPGERFASGVVNAGVPSALLTALVAGASRTGLKDALKAGGGAGLLGTGFGYLMAPKEKKILIPRNN